MGVQLCVANRAVRVLGEGDWPLEGKCFRGAVLPEEHLAFYAVGTKYRVPGLVLPPIVPSLGIHISLPLNFAALALRTSLPYTLE